MENKKPDNIVYTDEKGYNASFLPYATSVGAPIIKVDDVAAWKQHSPHAPLGPRDTGWGRGRLVG